MPAKEPPPSLHLEVRVYSGQPNPQWDLAAGQDSAKLYEDLTALLETTPLVGKPTTSTDGLGYQGLALKFTIGATIHLLTLHLGILTETDPQGNIVKTWKDANQAMEKRLIRTGKSTPGAELMAYLEKELPP
jgi:hypothetical protein